MFCFSLRSGPFESPVGMPQHSPISRSERAYKVAATWFHLVLLCLSRDFAHGKSCLSALSCSLIVSWIWTNESERAQMWPHLPFFFSGVDHFSVHASRLYDMDKRYQRSRLTWRCLRRCGITTHAPKCVNSVPSHHKCSSRTYLLLPDPLNYLNSTNLLPPNGASPLRL